jgi:hypothetical protein
MVCFRYIIINTQHKGDNRDNNNKRLTAFLVKGTWPPLISDGSGHDILGPLGLSTPTHLIQTCL